MPYTRTTWADFPSLSTPITAARLNNIEAFLDGMATVQDGWTAFTPSWTNVTTAGGTNVGAYNKVGKTVMFWARYTLGGTDVTGAINFALPFEAKGVGTGSFWGVFDDTGTTYFVPVIRASSSTTLILYAGAATGSYVSAANTSATVPHTWAANDVIRVGGVYEAA